MIPMNEKAPTQYSRAHAEIYDAIHAARGRNWAAEADYIAGLIFARCPQARSLLDVACGTGTHLDRFRSHFDEVAGLELSDAMREIADTKLPGITVHAGDMRDFDLRRSFDAVVCMCFSLGYMNSLAELEDAVACLARSVAPLGVVVAEPWWFPEQFLEGFVTGSIAEEEGRVISRLSHSVREGRVSRMTVRYTVAEPDGIRDFTEFEVYSLFTRDEYLAAFDRAGLKADYSAGKPNGRGLFIATRH